MTITDSARRLALVAVVAMLAALLPLSGAFAQDDPEVPAEDEEHGLELSGESAAEIAQAWSELAYSDDDVAADAGPSEVLLGRADLFADNLASGSLQGGTDNGRPLLLTDSDALDEVVADELERLGGVDAIDTVHILGGAVAISEDVADELADLGYTTERLEGETRTETAIDIAATAFADADTAVLVRSTATSEDATQEFADSLGAGAWAAEAEVPVLFTQTDTLTGTTADYLADSSIESVIIVGGDSAVSGDVETAVGGIVGEVSRVSGDTRFTTAIAVNDARELGGDAAIVVDGQEDDAWVNGFAAANVSGNNGFPLVLSNLGELPEASETYLEGFYADEAEFAEHLTLVRLICGTNAGDACDAAATIAGVTVYAYPFPEDPAPPTNSGIVTATDNTDDYTFVAEGADSATTVTVDAAGLANDDFFVDGEAASSGIFFSEIGVCDTVTFTEAGAEDGIFDLHELVNNDCDDIDAGTVGDVDLGLQEFHIIEPVTGTQLRGPIDYVTNAVHFVDGTATSIGAFEDDINEGDTITIEADAPAPGTTTFQLVNQIVSGTAADVLVNAGFDAVFTIGGLGDDFAAGDVYEASDPATPGTEVYIVDGEDVDFTGCVGTEVCFEDAISNGDMVTYERSGDEETFTIGNLAPATLAGLVALFNGTTALNGIGFDSDVEFLPTGMGTTGLIEYTAGAAFLVDGLLVNQTAFEDAVTEGDAITYRAGDASTSTTERVTLTNMPLEGFISATTVVVNALSGDDFVDIDRDSNDGDATLFAGFALDASVGQFAGTTRYFVDANEDGVIGAGEEVAYDTAATGFEDVLDGIDLDDDPEITVAQSALSVDISLFPAGQAAG